MTYTTEILENESGIQYSGVKDKSGGTGTYPITGLMTGIFKRGRFDKPMTITNENIRAQLGYDPKNSYYVAVQDVLSSGVPSVQVLRLKAAEISCAGAKSWVRFNSLDSGYDIKLNGKFYNTDENLPSFIRNNLEAALGCTNDGFCEISNNSYSDYQRIELIPTLPLQDMALVQIDMGTDVTPVYIDNITGHITFCLSPQTPV